MANRHTADTTVVSVTYQSFRCTQLADYTEMSVTYQSLAG